MDRLLQSTISMIRVARSPGDRSAGFSLLEVVVAMAILVVAISALAQVSTASTTANTSARTATFAALLASEKMEQLRALTWGYDAIGQPLSDTTTNVSVVPARAYEGVGLTPSPPGVLDQNVSGYCDFIDAAGRSIDGGNAAPAAAIYVRRWSVERLPSSPDNTLVLQVIVERLRASRGAAAVRPDEARLVTLKTRTKS